MPAPAAIHISPDAFYDDAALYVALDLRAPTLARARQSGELRFVRKGQRTLYLGAWIIDWLTAEVRPGGTTHAG